MAYPSNFHIVIPKVYIKYGQKSCGSILSSNKIVKFAECVEIKIALSKKLSSRKKLTIFG